MSSEFQVPPGQVPPGPPWAVDVVADVHAGVYPAELTAALLRAISADAEGAAILAALDSTVDELSLLPPLVMPERYVLRLDAVLGELANSMTSTATRSWSAVGTQDASVALRHQTDLSHQTNPSHQTDPSTRAGISALLQSGPVDPGRPAAPPGLPRPQVGRPLGAPPRLPRQVIAGPPPRPTVPPRHQPVIPRVLPGGPYLRSGPTPESPIGPEDDTDDTRPTAVSDLQAARRRSADRPADGSSRTTGPTGPAGSAGTKAPRPRIGSLEAQRAKRRRWTGGLLAAAAVVAVGGVTALALNRDSAPAGAVAGSATGAPVTVPTQLPIQPSSGPGVGAPAPLALVLTPGRFGDQLQEIEGKAPVGDTSLTNPTTYASCLAANNITGGTVTGVTEVTYQGQDAYAIAVNAGATSVRIVVVGTQCGQNGDAATLDSQTVSR